MMKFLRFLKIAKGSAAEVRSMLILAKELDFFTADEIQDCIFLCKEISQNLSNFNKYLENKIKK